MDLKKMLSFSLKHAPLFLGVLTVIAYVITVIERRIYYQAYGVDANLLGISFEITSIITVVTILIVSMLLLSIAVGWGYVFDRDRTDHPVFKVKLRFGLIAFTGLLLISLAIITYIQPIKPEIINARVVATVLSGIMSGYIIAALAGSYRKSRREKISILDAYASIIISPPRQEEIVRKSQGSKRTYRAAELVVMGIGFMVMTILMTGLITQAKIQSKTSYYYVEKETTVEEGETRIHIVVGKSDGGYVLKVYDLREKKFMDGFILSTSQDNKFKTINIESLKINSAIPEILKSLL